MTQEELKQKADELGHKIKDKKQELMKSHWDNMAKAFGVPDGGSVEEALNNDLYFINGDYDRTDWFAGELVGQMGVNGDHDRSHFRCVGGLCHLMCGAPYDTDVFLYVKCWRDKDNGVDLVHNMEFTDNSWSRGWDRKSCKENYGVLRYRERLPYVLDDFSNVESEAGLSNKFNEAVEWLRILKKNIEWRDELYPHLHKAVASMRNEEANSSKNKISNAEKALDNL